MNSHELRLHTRTPVPGQILVIRLPRLLGAGERRETAQDGITTTLLSVQVHLLRAAGYRFRTLARSMVSGFEKSVSLVFPTPHADTFDKCLRTLEALRVQATFFVPSGSIGTGNHPTWEMLVKAKDLGMEVGTQGYAGTSLLPLSLEEQIADVAKGIHTLEQKLGPGVRLFYYPGGQFNALTLKAMRENRVDWAVTHESGRNHPGFAPYYVRSLPSGGSRWHHLPSLVYPWSDTTEHFLGANLDRALRPIGQ